MLVSRFMKLALVAITVLAQSAIARPSGCTNPSVRREWRRLSRRERADWIRAVKCLNSLPHNSSLAPTYNLTYTQIPPINTSTSYFDDFIYTHMDLNPAIHVTGHFFPWHRAYVKDFETALKQKCGYKGTQPYWDWRLDTSNFENSTIWDTDPTSGLGSWGDPNNDYQIHDGGFADFHVSYPSPHKIRRQYVPVAPFFSPLPLAELFTSASQSAIINGFVGDFPGFQTAIEPGSHGAIHIILGGDMSGTCPSNAPSSCVGGPKWSPNDPIFMLHHGMVDKIWYDWQRVNPTNFWSYRGGTVSTLSLVDGSLDPTFPNGAPPFIDFATPIPTDGILNNYTIFELMDTKNDRLCYVYE